MIINKIKKIGLVAGFLWQRTPLTISDLKACGKIGLLAGVGRLPVEFIYAAHDIGIRVSVVAGVPGVDRELAAIADDYTEMPFGQLQGVLDCLHGNNVSVITMLGKVSKEYLFAKDVAYDQRFAQVLNSLPDRADDTLMLGFVRELQREKIKVIDQTLALRPLFVSAGLIAGREATPNEMADMHFALHMAREIGRLDIGQTVVVKNRAVMAVEAIEGTDACIRRSLKVSNGGAVAGKAAKPKQDLRFDVPTVGPNTIMAMIEGGVTALVIEAGKTLVVERRLIEELAVQHNLSIIAMQ